MQAKIIASAAIRAKYAAPEHGATLLSEDTLRQFGLPRSFQSLLVTTRESRAFAVVMERLMFATPEL